MITFHKKCIHITFSLCASIVTTGCVSSGKNFKNFNSESNLNSNKIFDATTYENPNFTQVNPEEIFMNGDKVKITINGFQEFSGDYTVDRNGNILLGHIGTVKAAGLSVPELQSNLYSSYKSCCLVSPNVSIEREGQTFGKIVVDGAVNDAGVYEIDEVIKLSQAVALGGGASELANKEQVMLARIIDGERKVSLVNLKDIQLAGARDPLIYPNDVIFIQDSTGRLVYNDFIKTIPLISAVILGATR